MARFFGISEYRVVKGEFWVNLLIRRTSNFFLFWIVKYKLNRCLQDPSLDDKQVLIDVFIA